MRGAVAETTAAAAVGLGLGAAGAAAGLREAAERLGEKIAVGWRWTPWAAAGAAVAARVVSAEGWEWVAAMAAMCVLWGAAAGASDTATRIVTERLSLSGAGCIGGVIVAHAGWTGEWRQGLTAALAGLAWAAAMEIVSLRWKDSVGGADVRVGGWAVAAAVWSLGPLPGVGIIAAAHLAAALYGLVRRRKAVALVGWLSAAAITAPAVAAAGVGVY